MRVDASLSVLIAAGLVLRVWAAFGPIFIPGSEVDPAQVLADRVLAFGFYVLWIPVLAITYRRDPRGRMWKLILLSFVMDSFWVFGSLHNPFAAVGWTIQQLTQPLASAVVAHMVLAFPSGRFRDRTDRWLMGITYTIVVPVMLLRFLVWDPPELGPCAPAGTFCPANVLLVARNDDLASLLAGVGYLAPLLAGLAILEVIRHWRTASAAGRRALAPFAFGMPFVFAIYGIIWFPKPAEIGDFIARYKLLDLASLLTPALFLVGTLRVRLARGSLAELTLELGRGVPLGSLRDSLARTLRDPTLQLAFAAPDGSGLVDAEGQPFDIDAAGEARSSTRLEHDDGTLLAVLVHDPAIDREDKGLVEAVGSVARLALDNERLSAQVRAQLEEVRASRQRIVEAGDAERRRVERDLHDGAQQRLVALVMRLEAARGDRPDGQALIDATTAELSVAIAEVRQLARGLHPAILSEAGLMAAVESLAERTPIPVEVQGDETRYPEPVEATAYFVIAEALTNVARHAGATHAVVTLRGTASELLVEVQDDGRGGADVSAGSGLRGLQDRVAAAGGILHVDSPPGEGTIVRAVIPIAQEHPA